MKRSVHLHLSPNVYMYVPSPGNIYGTLGLPVLCPSNSPHPGPSRTNLESWRRELHFGVKHAHIELFLGSISMKIDYNLGTHDDHDGGARAPPRARRARRPAGSFDTSCAVTS